MTSKTSFWKQCKTEIKRQGYMFGICAIAYLMIMIFVINGMLSDYREAIVGEDAGEYLKVYVAQYQKGLLWTVSGWDGFLLLISLGLGFICAIQAYGWINKANQIDFYGALPVKKSHRFWGLNLVQFLACISGLFITQIVANIMIAASGLWTGKMIPMSLLGILLGGLTFLASYGLTLIAVMLTGNSLLATLGGAFLLLVESIVYTLKNSYVEMFYNSVYYMQIQSRRIPFGITPLSGVLKITSAKNYWGGGAESLSDQKGVVALGAGMLLVQMIVFFAVAYFIYKKRPALNGEKQMIFAWSKPVIKVAILVVGALSVGIFGAVFQNNHPQARGFGLIAGLLVIQVVVQSLMDGNIRFCFRGWKSFLVGAAISLLVFGFYAGDWSGFDSKIPEQKNLSYVSWLIRDGGDNSVLADDGQVISNEHDILESRKFEDADSMDALLSTLKRARKSHADGKISVGSQESSNENVRAIHVKYQTKDGKTEYRSYYLEDKDIQYLKERVASNTQNRKAQKPFSVTGLKNWWKNGGKTTLIYQNQTLLGDSYTATGQEDVEKLIHLAEQSYLNRQGETEINQPVVGIFELQLRGAGESSYMDTINIPVYAADKEMIKELTRRSWLAKEDVADASEEVAMVEVNADSIDGGSISKTWSPDTKIGQLVLKSIVIDRNFPINSENLFRDNQYQVTVYLKDGSSCDGYFPTGKIPQEVTDYFDKADNREN